MFVLLATRVKSQEFELECLHDWANAPFGYLETIRFYRMQLFVIMISAFMLLVLPTLAMAGGPYTKRIILRRLSIGTWMLCGTLNPMLQLNIV